MSARPDKTEVCCHNLLISFDKVSEIADTSDGSWMNYYNGVVEIWLKSLALQKNKGIDDIADKIFPFLVARFILTLISLTSIKRSLDIMLFVL